MTAAIFRIKTMKTALTVYDDMCTGIVGGQPSHCGHTVHRLPVIVGLQPQGIMTSFGDIAEPSESRGWSTATHAVAVVVVGEL